jgi:hypothetical protein
MTMIIIERIGGAIEETLFFGTRRAEPFSQPWILTVCPTRIHHLNWGAEDASARGTKSFCLRGNTLAEIV